METPSFSLQELLAPTALFLLAALAILLVMRFLLRSGKLILKTIFVLLILLLLLLACYLTWVALIGRF